MTAVIACPNPIPRANHSVWAKYNTSNQLTSTSIVANYTYDDAGNTLNDGVNKYVYDLDGRICAVTPVVGGTMTQYVYDAEGRRIAKGTITKWPAAGATCAVPTAANGITKTGTGAALYLRGALGDQDTELDGTGVWCHTNVFVGGELTATCDTGTKSYLKPQLLRLAGIKARAKRFWWSGAELLGIRSVRQHPGAKVDSRSGGAQRCHYFIPSGFRTTCARAPSFAEDRRHRKC